MFRLPSLSKGNHNIFSEFRRQLLVSYLDLLDRLFCLFCFYFCSSVSICAGTIDQDLHTTDIKTLEISISCMQDKILKIVPTHMLLVIKKIW